MTNATQVHTPTADQQRAVDALAQHFGLAYELTFAGTPRGEDGDEGAYIGADGRIDFGGGGPAFMAAVRNPQPGSYLFVVLTHNRSLVS